MMLSTTRPTFRPAAIGCGKRRSSLALIESLETRGGHRFGGTFSAPAFRRYGRKGKVRGSSPSGNQIPSSDSSSGSWKLWLTGAILSAALAFWIKDWMHFLRIKKLVEEAEEVVGKIEEVAEEVEKVAAEVAEELPEGGKLRDEVVLVEKVAKQTAEDAHLAHKVFDKVEGVEEKAESFTDQANETAQEKVTRHENQN